MKRNFFFIEWWKSSILKVNHTQTARDKEIVIEKGGEARRV